MKNVLVNDQIIMSNAWSWSDGVLLKGRRGIDSFNGGLHYSMAVWEGIRAYKQVNGKIKIFKLSEHISRLFDSAKIVNLKIPYTHEKIMEGCKNLVEQYGNVDLYLRPIVYLGEDCVRPILYLGGDCEGKQECFTSTNVDIHACKIDASVLNFGNKAIISSYVRSYPEYNMQVKCAGNYDKIYAMYAEAKRSNAHHALVSDKNGYIVESATSNIFIQRGKRIFTPPDNGSILPGITRQLVIDILSDPLMLSKYNIDCSVKEKNLTRSDLYTADSIFLTGTMCEILAIHSVDGKEIGCAESKPYYQMILQEFIKLTRQV